MKKAKNYLSVTLIVIGFIFAAPATFGQTMQYVFPVQLYRFAKPGNEGGYLLTPYYSEGVAANWLYQGTVGFIYVPQLAGFPNTPTPVPVNPDLLPVHRWQVVQDGRPYFYYSLVYGTQGQGYTYQGIAGFMYPSSQNYVTIPDFGEYPLYKVKSCYSSSQGYWHGRLWPINLTVNPPIYQLENSPNSTFNCGSEHEVIGGSIFTNRGTAPDAPVPVPETSVGDYHPDEKTAGELFWFGQ